MWIQLGLIYPLDMQQQQQQHVMMGKQEGEKQVLMWTKAEGVTKIRNNWQLLCLGVTVNLLPNCL